MYYVRVYSRRWLKKRKTLRTFLILTISSLTLPMFVLFVLNPALFNLIQYPFTDAIDSIDPLLRELENAEKMNFEGFNNETGVDYFIVPNVIHFIRFNLPNFSFVDYVVLRAAMRNHRPDRFYIHTNLNPEDFHGKYWNLVQKDRELWSRIRILPLELPTEIFGQKFDEFYHMWHAADVQRIRIIMKYGGIYMDNDVFIVQNLDKYRRFECAMNWEGNLYLSNQVIIAHKDARFLALWLESYREYQPESWYYNGGEKPTIEILRPHPELIHRVEGWFGADSGVSRQVYDNVGYDWRIMDAIHLQFGDRIDLDRFYNDTPVLDENTIQDYKYPFGAMARLVLDDAPGHS